MSSVLRNLARRGRLAVARAVLNLIDDATKIQGVQISLLDGEVLNNVARMQQYGFTSVPLAGAEGVYLALGGSRDGGLLICAEDRRFRLKGMESGEVALYDDIGHKVHMTRNGIVIDGAGKPLLITNTPKARIESDLDVTGDIKDRCDSNGRTMGDMRTIYNGHTHSDPQGGSVSAPTEQM